MGNHVKMNVRIEELGAIIVQTALEVVGHLLITLCAIAIYDVYVGFG